MYIVCPFVPPRDLAAQRNWMTTTVDAVHHVDAVVNVPGEP
jgi:hypothetical protein